VSRNRDLEQRLDYTELQLRAVQRVSRFMAREMSLNDALSRIVSLVAEFMSSDSCLLYLVEGDQLVLCASSVPNPAAIGRVRLKLSEGLTGWVARERRLLAISRESYTDPRFKFFGDLPEDTFEAFLSVPILARNRMLGVINVQHRAPHSHTGGEMELLSTIGEQAGCLLLLSNLDSKTLNPVEAVMSAAPASPII